LHPCRYTFTLHGCRLASSGASAGAFRSIDAGRRPFVRVSTMSGSQYFAAGEQAVFLLGENIAFPGKDPIVTDYNYTNSYKYANESTYMCVLRGWWLLS